MDCIGLLLFRSRYLILIFYNKGMMESARDIFEEALEQVLTAKDFSSVYSMYLSLEEKLINLPILEDQ